MTMSKAPQPLERAMDRIGVQGGGPAGCFLPKGFFLGKGV